MTGARIHDRGYLHYEGPRGGAGAAVFALARHSARHLLGLRRGARAKLLPLAVGGIAYLPAAVFLGLVVVLPERLADALLPVLLPGSAGYVGLIMTPVYLFVALGTPAALCPDRLHGTLALYLASPLTRDTYLLARGAAVLAFLAIVTVGPALLLIVGLTLLGAGPAGVGGVLADLGGAVAAGLVVAGLLGTLAAALSSLTDRQMAASAFVVLWVLVSGVVVHGVLRGALDLPRAAALLDVTTVATEAVAGLHGATGATGLPTAAVLGAAGAWILAAAGLTRWRYHRLRLTR